MEGLRNPQVEEKVVACPYFSRAAVVWDLQTQSFKSGGSTCGMKLSGLRDPYCRLHCVWAYFLYLPLPHLLSSLRGGYIREYQGLGFRIYGIGFRA